MALAAEEHLDSIPNLGIGEMYNFETVVEMINEESGHDGEPELIENLAFDSVLDVCGHMEDARGNLVPELPSTGYDDNW